MLITFLYQVDQSLQLEGSNNSDYDNRDWTMWLSVTYRQSLSTKINTYEGERDTISNMVQYKILL